jgi:hypothetical protein
MAKHDTKMRIVRTPVKLIGNQDQKSAVVSSCPFEVDLKVRTGSLFA